MRMEDDGADQKLAMDRDRQQTTQNVARSLFRSWMQDLDGGVLERVGQASIRGSADAAAQLAALAEGSPADQILDDVERLFAAASQPPAAPRRWWQPGRAPIGTEATSDAVAPLIQRLERARDEGTRRTIAMLTLRTRFEHAGVALEDSRGVIAALGRAIEAGIRETRMADPVRAAAIEQRGSAALLERERALAMQIAVHGQGQLTLELLIANQSTVTSALENARTAAMSAFQVASAARLATSNAAAINGDGNTAAARRMLDDALARARDALHAMPRPPGGNVLDS